MTSAHGAQRLREMQSAAPLLTITIQPRPQSQTILFFKQTHKTTRTKRPASSNQSMEHFPPPRPTAKTPKTTRSFKPVTGAPSPATSYWNKARRDPTLPFLSHQGGFIWRWRPCRRRSLPIEGGGDGTEATANLVGGQWHGAWGGQWHGAWDREHRREQRLLHAP